MGLLSNPCRAWFNLLTRSCYLVDTDLKQRGDGQPRKCPGVGGESIATVWPLARFHHTGFLITPGETLFMLNPRAAGAPPAQTCWVPSLALPSLGTSSSMGTLCYRRPPTVITNGIVVGCEIWAKPVIPPRSSTAIRLTWNSTEIFNPVTY